jgi:predicted flap endonuclease-1-like 5' DNA nuclease
MLYRQLLVILPAVSLVLSGFNNRLAAMQESGGQLGWIGVCIALLLLIPLAWWLFRSSGSATAEHDLHAEAHAPIQAAHPVATEAVAPRSVASSSVKGESVATEVQEVVENVIDEVEEVAAAGEENIAEIAPDTEEPEQTFEAAVAQESTPTPRAQAVATPDDLTIIEGIGPKIARVLQENGFKTFADLAAADLNQVEGILQGAGLSNLTNPVTWAEQAQLAADGQWDELKTLQNQLKGGQRA